MYTSELFSIIDEGTVSLSIPMDREYRILQLTDLHLGFGCFSSKQDKQALAAVTELVKRTEPDLMVLTGDSVFPFWPRTGTADNEMQGRKFLEFMDGFDIPYALLMGNHDTEVGSKLNREELGEVFRTGRNSIFLRGPKDIFGVGNYMIQLRRGEQLASVLAILDSNMYADKTFFSGFDRIHPDQTRWCMDKLSEYRQENPKLEAMAFYHMPLVEFKEGYERMKMGDTSVQYHFGTVAEEEDYFGISCLPGDFFEKARENGIIKYMFCGHDHLNNISLTYQGIRMTYGMSIDCLGYKGIDKSNAQRGATLITLDTVEGVSIKPVPLTYYVTGRVRGKKQS